MKNSIKTPRKGDPFFLATILFFHLYTKYSERLNSSHLQNSFFALVLFITNVCVLLQEDGYWTCFIHNQNGSKRRKRYFLSAETATM